MSLRDQILSKTDLPREAVDVPEWDCTVQVRVMSGTERDRFELECLEHRNEDVRARVALFTVCDDDGKPLFTPADLATIGATSSAALDRILAVAKRLNRLGADDLKELAKN